MRYIIIILSIFVAYNAHSQVTDTQLRVRADQNPDSILIMSNDTNSSSAYYKTGKWRKASDIIGAVAGDTDWYKLGGTAIPTNSDSAYRTGYLLLDGLSGGLQAKVEFLKDGTLQFDYLNESSGETKVYQIVKPLQQSEGNVPWVSSIFTAANYGDRWNDVHSMGWNMEGGNVLEAGKQAFGWVSEGYYKQNATRLRFEDHTIWYGTDGIQRRPESLVITDGYYDEWYKYFTCNDVFGLDPRNNYKSFQFALNSDTAQSILYLWSPKSANTKGAEFLFNQTTNRLSISPIGTSNTTFDINAFPFTRAALIQRTEVASTYGLTMATIAGNTSDGYFGNITPGWGLTLASDVLKADTSKLATQYDLTLISSGATDLTIGGSGPTYTIESSTGTDVTIAAGTGVSLSESPANTLVITNTVTDTDDQGLTLTGTGPYTIDIDNGSDIIVDDLFGITLSEPVANTLAIKADTSVLATPYDISGFGTMSNWLLAASGTGGTETVTNGETVTISETTGLDVTRSTNTVAVALSIDEFSADATPEGDESMLVYDASGTNHELIDINDLPYLTTEVDGSTTNEIQTLDATGTTTVTWDLSSDATDISLTGAGISAISRSGNAVTVTSTEVDGSNTNEAWTADADDADTEVISNQTVKMEGGSGIVTDYVPASDKFTYAVDGKEFIKVTTPESDDFILMHDSISLVNQRILWTDLTMDIISFLDGNSSVGTGNAVDVGEGIDINMTGNEANINMDASEFLLDGTNETDESFLVYDPDTTAGHRIQRIPWSDVVGGTDTNFAEDDLTFTGNRSHDMGSNNLTLHGTAANMYIQDDNGGTGNSLVLVSEYGASNGIVGGISFQSENSGTPTELFDIEGEKVSSTQSILRLSGEQSTDAEIIYEKSSDLSSNTTQSHISINGGVAFTQNYDYSTAADLELDRSYHILNVTGGAATDTIKLPEVAQTTDNWSSSLSATQVQVGQEYTITNFRSATNLVVAAYNPTSGNSDLVNSQTNITTYSAIIMPANTSLKFRCVRLASGVGYWYTY